MRGGYETVTALIAVLVHVFPQLRPSSVSEADYIPIATPGRDLCDFQSRCKTDTLMLAVS